MIRFNCCVRRWSTKTYVEFTHNARNRAECVVYLTDQFPGWDYILQEDNSQIRQD